MSTVPTSTSGLSGNSQTNARDVSSGSQESDVRDLATKVEQVFTPDYIAGIIANERASRKAFLEEMDPLGLRTTDVGWTTQKRRTVTAQMPPKSVVERNYPQKDYIMPKSGAVNTAAPSGQTFPAQDKA